MGLNVKEEGVTWTSWIAMLGLGLPGAGNVSNWTLCMAVYLTLSWIGSFTKHLALAVHAQQITPSNLTSEVFPSGRPTIQV